MPRTRWSGNRPRGARLSDSQLLRFAFPLSWEQIIHAPGIRFGDAAWWREAVIEAGEQGRGLLAWNKETKRWRLSIKGRAHLRLPLR